MCSSIRKIGYLLQLVYRMPSIFVVVAALLFFRVASSFFSVRSIKILSSPRLTAILPLLAPLGILGLRRTFCHGNHPAPIHI